MTPVPTTVYNVSKGSSGKPLVTTAAALTGGKAYSMQISFDGVNWIPTGTFTPSANMSYNLSCDIGYGYWMRVVEA